MIYDDKEGTEYLRSIRTGTFKKGLKIDCILDDYLRWKRNNFNVFAGHANVGKTLVILFYFTCLAIKHNLKFAVFSSENEIGSLKDDIISIYAGRRIEKMSERDLQSYHAWLNEHFKFYDADGFFDKEKKLMHYRDIIKLAEDLPHDPYNFDFDTLVIDPYNSLGRDPKITGTTHEYDLQVTSHLRAWCKIRNKSIYLLAHGNTEALRKIFAKEHRFAGYPIPLLSADIEGGGKFVNRCDDFAVIHRMTQNPFEQNRTEIHVTKVKNKKTGGEPTFKDNPVIFDAQRGLFDFMVNLRGSEVQTETPPINPLQTHRDKMKADRGEESKGGEQLAMKPNKEFDNDIDPESDLPW